MKKKFISFGIAIGFMFGAAIIAYALTSFFFTKSETSSFSKKTFFQINLSTELQETEVGPGDSVAVEPKVYNDATEEMYVFVLIEQPDYDGESLYKYNLADGWKLVSSTSKQQVYAYAGDEMTKLLPGETTDALTSQLTMREITNADYYVIQDINVTINAYAIGIEDVSTDPSVAWEQCKEIGNLE